MNFSSNRISVFVQCIWKERQAFLIHVADHDAIYLPDK